MLRVYLKNAEYEMQSHRHPLLRQSVPCLINETPDFLNHVDTNVRLRQERSDRSCSTQSTWVVDASEDRLAIWDITVGLSRNYRTIATECCCPSNQVNITMALQATDWKIYGKGGATELLGLKPTTLLSRIKKMGIVKVG